MSASTAPAHAHDDHVRALVEEILRAGLLLTNLISGLLEDLPDGAFPGEEPAEVLLEMLCGSVRPAADAAGVTDVRQATALIGAVLDRTVDDLRAAVEIAAANDAVGP